MNATMDKRHGFSPSTFEHMRQRQVRQHAVVAVIAQAVVDAFCNAVTHLADARKVVHRTFGLTGGARGVNDHGQVVVVSQHITLQGLGASSDGVPTVIGCCGGQRQSNARHVFWHTGGLFVPFIEFPNEQQAGLTVLQHKLHCVCAFGGEDGHGGVTRHPNRHFGHEKVRTIFRQDGHFGTMGQPQGFQMRGHAARLVHR